jgi:hypothetical protein
MLSIAAPLRIQVGAKSLKLTKLDASMKFYWLIPLGTLVAPGVTDVRKVLAVTICAYCHAVEHEPAKDELRGTVAPCGYPWLITRG